MSDQQIEQLRQQLIDAIRGHQAHLDFDTAVRDFPPALQGIKAPGAPHTAWQLLEHMRIAQHDILEFSRNPQHQSPKWPDEYWPSTEAPPSNEAWDHSVQSFRQDAQEMTRLVREENLFQSFAHGEGQTLLREALLVVSHNSYHLGQIVFLRKALT